MPENEVTSRIWPKKANKTNFFTMGKGKMVELPKTKVKDLIF